MSEIEIHESIIRNRTEIENTKAKAQVFAKEHPYSGFGDDNIHRNYIENKIFELALSGYSKDYIQDYFTDEYGGASEDDYRDYDSAQGVLYWLIGEKSELY